jgi:acyl-coenzyme A synthetase/AMP-(fatty) acid ligase
LTHHKIADAGVCGVHSEEQATELPRAYVVPIGGLDSLKTEDDRRRFAKEVKEWVAKQVSVPCAVCG